MASSEQLWGHKGSPPPSVRTCTIPLRDDVADVVINDWKQMLLKVRQGGEPRMGLDGETFHFSMRQGTRFMAGEIWTPEPNSNDAILVGIALKMQSLCQSRAVIDLEAVQKLARDLAARL